MSGKATTEAEITAACQVKTIFRSNSARKSRPMGPLIPNSLRRKNPTTVGGRIIGNVMMQSTIDFPVFFNFRT